MLQDYAIILADTYLREHTRKNRGWCLICNGHRKNNQDHHFYSRLNFKLNRAAAFADWRQLLSA